jgi:CRP-like cAMP-binding protein
MYPRLYMPGDYVTRTGDVADALFFIKKGRVEVLAADNEDVVIAIMAANTFLGEIGLLL